MTTSDLNVKLEKIRQDLHNGKDVYGDIVNLQDQIDNEGINVPYITAHCRFVESIMDGVKPDIAYENLVQELEKQSNIIPCT